MKVERNEVSFTASPLLSKNASFVINFICSICHSYIVCIYSEGLVLEPSPFSTSSHGELYSPVRDVLLSTSPTKWVVECP